MTRKRAVVTVDATSATRRTVVYRQGFKRRHSTRVLVSLAVIDRSLIVDRMFDVKLANPNCAMLSCNSFSI